MGRKKFQFKTDIAKRYLDGENSIQIAKSEGCCSPTIRDNLVRMGVELRSRKEAKALMRIEFRTNIVKRYLGGESTIKIARDEECCDTTVRNRLVEKGIEMRSGLEGRFEKWAKQDDKKLKELWLNHALSKRDIARKLNRSKWTIWHRAWKFGWTKTCPRPHDRPEPKKAICVTCGEKYTYMRSISNKYCPKCRMKMNRGYSKIKSKIYYRENKEKEIIRKQVWYQKNKKRIIAHQREYRRKKGLTLINK